MNYKAIQEIKRLLPAHMQDSDLPWREVVKSCKVRQVKLSELREFVLAQPDDKPVNIYEAGYYCRTGDLMVQFGKHKGWFFNFVGIKGWFLSLDQLTLKTSEIHGERMTYAHLFKGGKPPVGFTYGEYKRQLI